MKIFRQKVLEFMLFLLICCFVAFMILGVLALGVALLRFLF